MCSYGEWAIFCTKCREIFGCFNFRRTNNTRYNERFCDTCPTGKDYCGVKNIAKTKISHGMKCPNCDKPYGSSFTEIGYL